VERRTLGQGMTAMSTLRHSEAGTSLIEVMIALVVLSVGALGMAGVFTQGMEKTMSSPGDLVATQKAAEAVETVFSARDSHTITWAEIRNVEGVSGSDDGVFLDGPQPLTMPGDDGLVNTDDDEDIEQVFLPGPDQFLGTEDDVVETLTAYTREIQIVDLQDDLRSVTVTVTYRAGASIRTYTLTTYISNYS
jgi:hypothetical protein